MKVSEKSKIDIQTKLWKMEVEFGCGAAVMVTDYWQFFSLTTVV